MDFLNLIIDVVKLLKVNCMRFKYLFSFYFSIDMNYFLQHRSISCNKREDLVYGNKCDSDNVVDMLGTPFKVIKGDMDGNIIVSILLSLPDMA